VIRLERDIFGERIVLVVTPSCGAFRFWLAPFTTWKAHPLYLEKAYGARLFGCGPLRGMHFPGDRVV